MFRAGFSPRSSLAHAPVEPLLEPEGLLAPGDLLAHRQNVKGWVPIGPGRSGRLARAPIAPPHAAKLRGPGRAGPREETLRFLSPPHERAPQ